MIDVYFDTPQSRFEAYLFQLIRMEDNFVNNDDLTNSGWQKQSDGSFYVESGSAVYSSRIFENTDGYTGKMVISYEIAFDKGRSITQVAGVYPIIKYTDGTNLATSNKFPTNMEAKKYYKITIVTDATKIVDYVFFSYGTGANPTKIKNFIIARYM